MGYELFFHPNTVGSKARFHTFFAGAHVYCNAIAKIPARNDKKPTGLFCCFELSFLRHFSIFKLTS